MGFKHPFSLRCIKNVVIAQLARIGKLLDAAIVWLPAELENCGVVESRLNACTEEWQDEGVLLDWTEGGEEEEEEAFVWALLFVAFEISPKILVKGKADKPSIAPVAPTYFKKSRRKILPSSVLDSFLDGVIFIFLDDLYHIIEDDPMIIYYPLVQPTSLGDIATISGTDNNNNQEGRALIESKSSNFLDLLV